MTVLSAVETSFFPVARVTVQLLTMHHVGTSRQNDMLLKVWSLSFGWSGEVKLCTDSRVDASAVNRVVLGSEFSAELSGHCALYAVLGESGWGLKKYCILRTAFARKLRKSNNWNANDMWMKTEHQQVKYRSGWNQNSQKMNCWEGHPIPQRKNWKHRNIWENIGEIHGNHL